MSTYLLYLLLLILHPFHISVCDIEHNPEQNSLQISHKIFLDDLEEAINSANQTSYDLYEPKDPELVDRLIGNYILDHFQVMVDRVQPEISYLGHEKDLDAAWCYVEIKGVNKIKNLQVINNILFEIHEDQTNIVHVSYNGVTKSTRLAGDKYQDTIDFE